MRQVKPYSVLAAGYDFVMAHVDYPGWATYIDELILRYNKLARTPVELIELGCGTGSFGFEFIRLGGYKYRGLDGSREMVNIAQRKSELWNEPIDVGVVDFLSFNDVEQYDVALLLYDGLNYLLDKTDIADTLSNVFRSVRPGGLFLFDQSTPANSENNREFFEDRGAHEDFAYLRQSEYDSDTRLHRTRFEFTVGEQVFVEDHAQRAYDVEEIEELVSQSDFDKLACFEGFSTISATDAAERVQWILRRPM